MGNDHCGNGRYHQKKNPADIQNREGRTKLPVRAKCYFLPLLPRESIGYKRCIRVGRWVIRIRFARPTTSSPYIERTFALADDLDQADGKYTLSFEQAWKRALEWSTYFRAKGRFPLEPENTPPEIPNPEPSSRYTVAHAARDYFHWQQYKGVEYIRALYTWRTYIESEFSTVAVDELTAAMVWKWFESILNSATRVRAPWGGQAYRSGPPITFEEVRCRRRTATGVLVALRAMLNHAYATGRVESKSAWDRIKGFAPPPMPRQRFLSVEECKRLLEACQPDLRAFIEAGLLTGCRFGEVKRLKVEDFIAESGKLFIHRTKRNQSRTVTLTAKGIDLFTRQILGKQPDDYMLAPANAQCWIAHRYYSRMQRTADRVNIPPPVNYQILRRTYASHAAMAGVPLLVIANQLGHVNIRTLERHYAQLSVTYVDEEIRNKMPDLA